MPTIGDLSHGFDKNAVAKYLDELKSYVLTEAVAELHDIGEIRTACEANWEGQARITFLENVQKDADHVGKQFEELYRTLEVEINNLANAMSTFDYNMIDKY